MRVWLLDRIDAEARAYRNADPQTRQIRWGRLLGFLEVGIHLGWWSKRSADGYADAVYHRAKVKARRMLRR